MVVLRCVDCKKIIKTYKDAKEYKDDELPKDCVEKRHTFILE